MKQNGTTMVYSKIEAVENSDMLVSPESKPKMTTEPLLKSPPGEITCDQQQQQPELQQPESDHPEGL